MSSSTFLVQVASVPGNQVGQRRFEQSRHLHDLLIATLSKQDVKDSTHRIGALCKLVPQHEIVLRSGFSQTAQWGLEPNMYLEIRGDEKQARMISALLGEAFCQDGVGIGGGYVEGQSHSVLIINGGWENEEERLQLISNILQQYPFLSAQLDINGKLAFHDYSLSSSSLDHIIRSIDSSNHGKYAIEERQMTSSLVDRTEYEQLLSLLESSMARRAFNILRQAHARLFSGYACGSLTLPYVSLRRRQKRHEQRKDKNASDDHYPPAAPHLCSLVFIARQPCMCLMMDNCLCSFTLVLATRCNN